METIHHRKWFGFVLFIPLINAIATLTTNYFPAGNLNPGTLRAFIIGVFFLYFLIKIFPVNKPNISIRYWWNNRLIDREKLIQFRYNKDDI